MGVRAMGVSLDTTSEKYYYKRGRDGESREDLSDDSNVKTDVL